MFDYINFKVRVIIARFRIELNMIKSTIEGIYVIVKGKVQKRNVFKSFS